MHRTSLIFALGLAASFAIASISGAQGPTIAETQMSPRRCTVPSCALEIRRGFFFYRIYRGGGEGESAQIGWTGASVVRMVDGLPDAVDEARQGRRHMIRSNTSFAAAIGGSVAALVGISAFGEDNGLPLALIFMPISIGGAYYGQSQRFKAAQAFDRAVWLYNRNIESPAAPPVARPGRAPRR